MKKFQTQITEDINKGRKVSKYLLTELPLLYATSSVRSSFIREIKN